VSTNASMLLSWLAHDGPQSAKHRGWRHPIVAFFIHYVLVASIMVVLHDIMISSWENSNNEDSECSRNTDLRQRQNVVSVSLAVYFCLFFAWRLVLQHQMDKTLLFVEFYRQTFLCSVTIFCSSLAFYTGRPLIAQAFCIAVGIDQLLWYDIPVCP
jgi:hypothetical protein